MCRSRSVGMETEVGNVWWVYLLECRGGRIYTGIARDVELRVRAHAAGTGARFTRAHPPQRLLASFALSGRGEALRTEAAIKRLTPAAKREIAAGLRPLPATPA